MKNKWLYFYFFLFVGCSPESDQSTPENLLINQVRKQHGVDQLVGNGLRFTMREMEYTRIPADNGWTYLRQHLTDDGDTIIDEWMGDLVTRTVNGAIQIITQEKANAYKNSINSVFYFALLPDALADEAVRVQLLGDVTIRGKTHHKFQVTFSEDGGGEDFEDIYLYWIEKESKTVNYFAYQFFTEDGGMRFREVSKARVVNGFRFQDYKNYKPLHPVSIYQLDSLFEAGGMEMVSEIILENIQFPLR